MSNHTPGPWKVDEMCCYIWGKDNGEPFTVAEIRGWGQLAQQHKETEAIAIQEANARLIAAAPEMKELLEGELYREEAGVLSWEREAKIRAILKRIEGEEV